MTQAPDGHPPTVDDDEAARLLEVDRGRLDDLVAEGLLTPIEGAGPRHFARAEVLAVRMLGA
jgi:hypothetical protein